MRRASNYSVFSFTVSNGEGDFHSLKELLL